MGFDLFEEKLNNETKTVLLEDSRTQLLNKSKRVNWKNYFGYVQGIQNISWK